MIVTSPFRPAMSRRSRGILWAAGAATVALGLLNVGLLTASEPGVLRASAARPPSVQQECSGLIELVRAATEAGQMTPEEGKQRVASCLDAQAVTELREAVASGLITEQQAREKLAARRAERRGDAPPVDPAKQAEIERIKEALAAGTITADDAKAQVAALMGPSPAECEQLRVDANAATQANAADAERMQAKVNAVCGSR